MKALHRANGFCSAPSMAATMLRQRNGELLGSVYDTSPITNPHL
jgi:hypothetical protein